MVCKFIDKEVANEIISFLFIGGPTVDAGDDVEICAGFSTTLTATAATANRHLNDCLFFYFVILSVDIMDLCR